MPQTQQAQRQLKPLISSTIYVYQDGPGEEGAPLVAQTGNLQGLCVLKNREEQEAYARLFAAAPALRRAAVAHHAWAYAEDHTLGTFDQRSILCVHAQALTDIALAKADGTAPAKPYEGMKRLIVWPQVRLETAEEAEAEALVRLCLEHEANSQKESATGNGVPAGAA